MSGKSVKPTVKERVINLAREISSIPTKALHKRDVFMNKLHNQNFNNRFFTNMLGRGGKRKTRKPKKSNRKTRKNRK